MSTQDSASVHRTHFEAFNNRQFDRGVALVAEDCEWVDVPSGQTFRGREGYRQFTNGWLTAFPDDAKVEIRNQIASGEWVVTEFIARGTNTGPFLTPAGPISPTGRRMDMPFVEVAQVRNGKFVRARVYYDLATLMQQLGLMPSEAPRQQPLDTEPGAWI